MSCREEPLRARHHHDEQGRQTMTLFMLETSIEPAMYVDIQKVLSLYESSCTSGFEMKAVCDEGGPNLPKLGREVRAILRRPHDASSLF